MGTKFSFFVRFLIKKQRPGLFQKAGPALFQYQWKVPSPVLAVVPLT